MALFTQFLATLRRDEEGQGLAEYALILALTVVFTVVILGVFGGTVSDVLSLIANAIDAATGGG
jgi:Flp pilus assembly pilin Flp